jgi:hypothetical protein
VDLSVSPGKEQAIVSESLAHRLSRLGSSGYIKVGGSRGDPEGPWRESVTTKPEDRPRGSSKNTSTVPNTKTRR